ncbi:hypothetical protein NC653_028315 [Populus alba x Populus x berolinensis]|uniref:Uncharacterized protein n=1 Tax=Populus alba x Populus x berolinensis TaxID=444605 RepID=A0AAD6M7Q3_9ROSI|nr:hypothetical protein NC653_028315 [Populus alba x Populus x berolinensis]
MMRKSWDALFMPEEVVRINFGLHPYQSVEVILEVLGAPNTCFWKACVSLLVHSQIKVPVIDICLSWKHGNIRFHVPVNHPSPIGMFSNIFFRISPIGQVLDHEQGTFSMRERSLRFGNFAHVSTIRGKNYSWIVFF